MNVMDKLIVFNGCVGVNNVIFGLFKNLFRGFELQLFGYYFWWRFFSGILFMFDDNLEYSVVLL